MNVKRGLGLPALIILFLFNVGCDKSQPKPNPATPNGDRPKAEGAKDKVGSSQRPAEFDLSVADFIAVCKDKAAAKQKFEGRIVKLRGAVRGFDGSVPPIVAMSGTELNWGSGKEKNGSAGTELQLKVPNSDGFHFVSCYLSEKQPWARLAKGQQVTVTGTAMDPTYGVPSLKKAVVEVAEPSNAVASNTKDIINEYERDWEGSLERHKNKSTILTGEIVSREDKGDGWVTLQLKGTDKTVLICTIRKLSETESKPLVKGAQIKLYGEFDETMPSGKVVLDHCLLIRE